MKILYISPENTVGTLSLWKNEHESNGHICRTLTFFHSPKLQSYRASTKKPKKIPLGTPPIRKYRAKTSHLRVRKTNTLFTFSKTTNLSSSHKKNLRRPL